MKKKQPKTKKLDLRMAQDELEEVRQLCKVHGISLAEATRRGLKRWVLELSAANNNAPVAARSPYQAPRERVTPRMPSLPLRSNQPF
jgi:hypothetical protein